MTAAAPRGQGGTISAVNVADLERGPALDAQLIWYFDVLSGGRADLRGRFLTEPRLSAPALTGTLEALRGAHGRLPVWAALHVAENPNAPVELLHAWVTDEGVGVPVRRCAARNPQLGTSAVRLYGALPDEIRRHLLTNPKVNPEFIAERWVDAPELALPNPVCDPRIVNDQHLQHPEALAHPGIDDDVRRSALRSRSARRRVAVLSNPNNTNDEIARSVAVELRDDDPVQRIIAAGEAILHGRRWQAHPLQCPAATLSTFPWHPRVHAALSALDPTALDAVRSLTRSHFDGTVAELLDVASTFT